MRIIPLCAHYNLFHKSVTEILPFYHLLILEANHIEKRKQWSQAGFGECNNQLK